MPRTKQMAIKRIVNKAKKSSEMPQMIARKTIKKFNPRFKQGKVALKEIRKYHKSVKIF
jgi:hypothetical protein